MKTCLNRLIGRCKNKCLRDYDTNHHPNNYDCSKYHEITMLEFTVVKVNLAERVYIKINEIIGKISGRDGELSRKILEEKARETEKIENAMD